MLRVYSNRTPVNRPKLVRHLATENAYLVGLKQFPRTTGHSKIFEHTIM